jgi:GTP cyclohydrolase I
MVHHIDNMHAEGAGNHAVDNLMVLCRGCHLKEHRAADGRLRGLSRFEKGILYVLEGMRRDFGIDMTDDNFVDTPKRFSRAMAEILSGAFETEQQVAGILSTAFDGAGFDEILAARKIEAVSLCPHHLLPVKYEISVAYLPGNGRVLGLSKLVRLAGVLAARPVLQETMTIDIAKALMEKVQARGAAVFVKGQHSCMWARGVRQNSEVVTSACLGFFREDANARREVEALLGIK